MMRLAVLISGRGSNLKALIDATAEPSFPAQITCVIANRADAGGLALAQAAGIPTQIIPHRDYADRPAFEAALDTALRAAKPDLVCLAGFMRVLTAPFVSLWLGRMINIHPSLLPAFPGLDTHQRALDAGVLIAGCTVHFVVPDVDAGPPVVQAAVPVQAGDNAASLSARVLAAEHAIYPHAVRLLASGAVRWVDGVIERRADASPPLTLINPTLGAGSNVAAPLLS